MSSEIYKNNSITFLKDDINEWTEYHITLYFKDSIKEIREENTKY